MIKFFIYLIQSIFIYFFFIFGRILGISLSRKIFGYIFLKIGPIIKSKKIIDNNLSIFSKNLSLETKNKIISLMWKNYGMTFIEK